MKKRVINWLLRKYLCAVIAEDVITIAKDKQGNVTHLFLNGELVTENEAKSLKEEVRFLKNTRLWSIFQNTLANQARKTMFELSKDYDDMRNGKMMLYNLDVQKNILSAIDKYVMIKK